MTDATRFDEGGAILGKIAPFYTARLPVFRLGARFLPELNAILAGMAGAVHASVGRFVGYAIVSALVWAGVWVGLGHVFGHALTVTANFLGIRLVVLFVGAFALYLPFQRTRRHRLIQMVRGTPPDGPMICAIPRPDSRPRPLTTT